jgi:hypothetical protein
VVEIETPNGFELPVPRPACPGRSGQGARGRLADKARERPGQVMPPFSRRAGRAPPVLAFLPGLQRVVGPPVIRAYQRAATKIAEAIEDAKGLTNQAVRAMAAAISTGFWSGRCSSIVDRA